MGLPACIPWVSWTFVLVLTGLGTGVKQTLLAVPKCLCIMYPWGGLSSLKASEGGQVLTAAHCSDLAVQPPLDIHTKGTQSPGRWVRAQGSAERMPLG